LTAKYSLRPTIIEGINERGYVSLARSDGKSHDEALVAAFTAASSIGAAQSGRNYISVSLVYRERPEDAATFERGHGIDLTTTHKVDEEVQLMSGRLLRLLAPVVVAGVLGIPPATMAEGIHANADGYQVVPSQNSLGTASFRAKVDRKAQTIQYQLSWQDLKGNITQSHIHFGSKATNGDIVVFLCTNLGNAPAVPPATPTPLCEGPQAGSASRTVGAGDIVALTFGGITPAQQLLPFADFDELADAIDAGAAYIVVHTTAQPTGELRGQIKGDQD
jgi:CHRD domain-containing protein